MASVPVVAVAAKAEDWPLANPWTWMLTALAATGLAFGWARLLGDAAEGGRWALLLVGLLSMGIGLWVGLSSAAGTARPLPRPTETFLAGMLAVGALLLGGWLGWQLLLKAAEFWQEYWYRPPLGFAPPAEWTAAEFCFQLFILACAILLTAVFAAAAFRTQGWTAKDRGAALLGCAVLAMCLASWALYLGPEQVAEWDSMRLLLSMASLFALVAAALYWLPRQRRRAGVSALVVLHLVGIGSAALGAPPQPWVVNQLWTRFYRPYLEFMYLNNAYRYYSPEPGPPSLLWFHVEYVEGELVHSRWIYLPDLDTEKGRHRHALGLIYQRRLSLTQNTEPGEAPPPIVVRGPDGGQRMNPVYEARWQHAPQNLAGPIPLGHIAGPPAERGLVVPFHQDLRPEMQIVVPNYYSKHLLSSYSRHVLSLPHPKHPNAVPKRVKVYRVVHSIILPLAYARGLSPTDIGLYQPYYEGEFDREGQLTPEAQRDPFLYWLLPSVRETPNDPLNSKIRCYFRRHAGDRDWVLWPDKTWHEE